MSRDAAPTPTVGIITASSPMRVICPLHGIRTLAVWQKGLSDLAGSYGWVCRLDRWSYGRFSLLAFFTPWSREATLGWLRRQYDAETHDRRLLIEKGQAPSVVAHSFGTYILGYTLLRFDFIRFNKVILCGSILPRDFPWDQLIARGQVQAVRNEFGVRDPWVKWVRWFVRGTGPSGAVGFTCTAPAAGAGGVRLRPRGLLRPRPHGGPLGPVPRPPLARDPPRRGRSPHPAPEDGPAVGPVRRHAGPRPARGGRRGLRRVASRDRDDGCEPRERDGGKVSASRAGARRGPGGLRDRRRDPRTPGRRQADDPGLGYARRPARRPATTDAAGRFRFDEPPSRPTIRRGRSASSHASPITTPA